ncbi:MAG: hypothetical protein J6O49_10050, partial [Bacteroidaceae bacterium]|nr:hypothetical protein [Bacteroidaceae bacterium]
YEEENESIRSDRKKIVVLGSGPIRIGQGVEFDYTTVHAIWGIQEAGYEAIIIITSSRPGRMSSLLYKDRATADFGVSSEGD